MTNTQTYCDCCGERWNTFCDELTVANAAAGKLTLQLCWKCGKRWYDEFRAMKDKVAVQRRNFMGPPASAAEPSPEHPDSPEADPKAPDPHWARLEVALRAWVAAHPVRAAEATTSPCATSRMR